MHQWLMMAALALMTGCGRDFPALLSEAEQSFGKKDYIGTIDTLNRALPRWKESDGAEKKARAYELQGKSYHQLRNTDKAIESYQEAVDLSKNVFESANALGILYLAKAQPMRAADAFDRALAMKPNDPQALLGLANSYYAQKKYEDARIYYQKVLDVSPGVRDALDSLQALRSIRSAPVRKAAPAKKKAAPKPASKKKKR